MSLSDDRTQIVGAILDRLNVHYYVLREYLVEAQNGDGTLELSPVIDDTRRSPNQRFAGLKNVQIWGLTPGTKIQVSAGSLVLVGFLNGQPSKRYVLGIWGAGSCTKLVLQAQDLHLGAEATEAAFLGTTALQAQIQMLAAIQADCIASASALAAAGAGALDPLAKTAFLKIGTTFATMAAKIGQFNGNASKYLSKGVKIGP